MKKLLPDWLILCVWRALLGEIYPSIRAIPLGLSTDRTLTIRYYLDRIPIELDEESLEVLATNISASIGLEKISKIEIESQFSMDPIRMLDDLDGFVYCRREYH